jgi:hypothetical protein
METDLKPKKARKPRAKKPAANKQRQPRKPRAEKPLPDPVEVNGQAAEPPRLATQDEGNGGLLEGIGDLFQIPQKPREKVTPFPVPSNGSSTSEPLTPEAERILRTVPDVIGEDPALAGEPQSAGVIGDEDPITALMAQVAFEPQDVQDVIAETFDWLAERFESDHWRLTDRQARMLGRPSAQLLNSIWAKLSNYLPDILSRWCESTPGATAFLLAAGMVITPKVMQQVAISRERKATTSPVQPGPKPVSVPQQPRPEGLIYDKGGLA